MKLIRELLIGTDEYLTFELLALVKCDMSLMRISLCSKTFRLKNDVVDDSDMMLEIWSMMASSIFALDMQESSEDWRKCSTSITPLEREYLMILSASSVILRSVLYCCSMVGMISDRLYFPLIWSMSSCGPGNVITIYEGEEY